MKQVLIAGKGSYIGEKVAQYLAALPDYQVSMLDTLNLAWRQVDFSPYDAVFHVAGIAHQKENIALAPLYYQVNCDLAVEMAKRAKEGGVRQFVFMSSMSVYGMVEGVINGSTVPHPTTHYGRSKLLAEEGIAPLADESFLVSILRPPMVYGEGCRGNYQSLVKLAKVSPICPDYHNRRSMLSIETLCSYVKELLDCPRSGIFFPQESSYVNTCDMLQSIARQQGKTMHATPLLNPIADLARRFTTKGKKAFGNLVYNDLRELPLPVPAADPGTPAPRVSVVMPAYNARATVEAAIDSVLHQSFSDWELIVVDDCSVDDTARRIEALAQRDPRIILLRNSKNCGVSESRNRAVSRARGEWIAFLDSDDLWREDKLAKQLALTRQHPDGVLFYTASAFIDADGHPLHYVMPVPETITHDELLRRNLISCSSVLVKRSVISRIPMVRDDLHEDYVAWLTILRQEPCAYGINEPLLRYRLSPSSKSASRIKSAQMLFRAYRYVGYDIPKAGYMTCRYSIHSITKRYKIATTN